jgi:tellurite resistance protein TerC
MNNEHWLWLIFAGVVIAAMAIDLGLKSHRERTRPVSFRESASWTAVWMVLAFLFAGMVYAFLGSARATEFLAAYLIEESLSVDNMFVFVLIFSFFKIPGVAQPRILKYGIFGAILMRFILIVAGVASTQRFNWIFYFFGALLIYTSIQLLRGHEAEVAPDQNWLLRFVKRFIPATSETKGQQFFIRSGGRLLATPLFMALLVVEASDLLFAMDSIPAVLAISTHPFIIFSSNVFAILGLRALYFLVSGMMGLFRFLRVGLAVVLMFIGGKMLAMHIVKIPTVISLAVVIVCLSASVAASILIKPARENS